MILRILGAMGILVFSLGAISIFIIICYGIIKNFIEELHKKKEGKKE